MSNKNQNAGPERDRLKIDLDFKEAAKKALKEKPDKTPEGSDERKLAQAMTRREAFFRLWAFFAVLLFLIRNGAAWASGGLDDLYHGFADGGSAGIAGSVVGSLVGYGGLGALLAGLACLAVKRPNRIN